MERVISYIDGFNLYFGLRAKAWQRYYWLNVQALSQYLINSNQVLHTTKYFTSRVSGHISKQERQNIYLDALCTLHNFEIFYGQFQSSERVCYKCNDISIVPNEKMTDVNIAVELLVDAYQDKFDTALLISADSDLSAPIKAIRRLFPRKRVIVVFPPERFSNELKRIANGHYFLRRSLIAKSLLPMNIVLSDGTMLRCPDRWQN